ncbi:myb-like protein X [Drosophila sulfurigaster albostrigata]|uniref:myb-like protein X n=1 Tax=Drosophila sulfurigaster albostrigata TaxID=89887 RepID=UPI002D21AD7C|nr:myb-like protein X [Drosophila sulfurigaster albostrigata]
MDTKSNDDSGGSDSLDKSMQRKCVMVETTATTTTATNITTEPDNCSRDSATVQQEDDQVGPSTQSGESVKANNNNNNITTTATTTAASAAFETKVKLISQNLKETKLAEETGSDEVTTASASSNEQEEVQEEEPSGDRLKKVHFHPDAKESDGGNNRVKKKWKSSQNHGGDGANLGCDGMEMDVTEDEQNADGGENEAAAEDEEEEEEEFNLAKTIAEAEDYLKQHPLTFVRRVEQNGELNTKEASQLEQEKMIEGDEDERHEDNDDEDSEIDFYKNCKPENGIERILGKETKAGKVEFLLRFENQGGLSWESEEFIRCMCPTLLKLYEQNRERRQQRLMHHVAKRQSLRQRYTDF